jgi:hypothetical protein
MGNYVAQLFSWVCNFTPILISLFWQLTGRAHWAWKGVGGGCGVVRAISEKWGNYLTWQPTIAARLLGNGGKMKPYTIIIMQDSIFLKKMRLKNHLNPIPKQNWVNHRIVTHWKTPVSSRSPSLLMQIYSC